MRSRDPREYPRAATPLELLYDLCFVVAVAQAAASLHHALAEGHAREGLIGYGLVFFAIWWAWMGFTWFASAFDTDDPLYRVKVLVQMAGVLVLAAGIPRAFNDTDFGLVTVGYAIMRVGLIAQWLRAASAEPAVRTTALRYASGIALLQLGWLALLAVPSERWILGWFVLAPLELLVPWWAERAAETSWHPHHIAERYGLFTIIVIGESVLAATLAIQAAIDREAISAALASVIVAAPVILFAMWWLYFLRPAHAILTSNRRAFVWGYGHFFVFGSAAAVGAGLAVMVDHALGTAHSGTVAAAQALSIPVAVYLLFVWLIHLRSHFDRQPMAYPITAALVLLAPWTPFPAAVIAGLLVALVALSVRETKRAA